MNKFYLEAYRNLPERTDPDTLEMWNSTYGYAIVWVESGIEDSWASVSLNAQQLRQLAVAANEYADELEAM